VRVDLTGAVYSMSRLRRERDCFAVWREDRTPPPAGSTPPLAGEGKTQPTSNYETQRLCGGPDHLVAAQVGDEAVAVAAHDALAEFDGRLARVAGPLHQEGG